LPSNLRPTTRECVHKVTRGHFQSRDKDGGHIIRFTIAENPKLQANFVALCYIELKLLPIKVLHCGNRDFRYLLLWPWLWSDDLHTWTWPVFA